MSIERYRYKSYDSQQTDNILMHEDGEFVLYADHAAEVARLTGERDELQHTFDLHHKADMRGIAAWQKATGKELVWPDKARLVEWCLAERAAAVAAKERAVNVLADLQWSYLYQGARCPHPSCHAFVDDGHVLECPIGKIIAAAQDAKPRTPEPSLVPVYPGPDLKRGDIVYTPNGNRVEVYGITEDNVVYTSTEWFCASVLRRDLEPEQGGPEGEDA